MLQLVGQIKDAGFGSVGLKKTLLINLSDLGLFKAAFKRRGKFFSNYKHP